MNTDFIENIYRNHNSKEGREKLYRELSIVEANEWEKLEKKSINNWTQVFSEKASTFANNTVITEIETTKSYSYQDLDEASEKIKNYIINHHDEYKIGLNYHNSFAFMVTVIGINKAGRLAILFNNREPKERIESLAKSTKIKTVFGNAIAGINTLCIESILAKELLKTTSNKATKTTLDDPAFVIFTSGTSGPSKPALFSHRRMLGAGIAWSLRTAMKSENKCYIALPLYHGNALAVAFSSVLYSGASALFRVKFSVSNFWSDINKYECSHMVYIGELWRYLVNTKKKQENPNKSLKVIFGNGLNDSLWKEVVSSYNIRHVVEHFGSTEMPAGALTNWMNIEGFCGYLPIADPRVQEMVLVDQDFRPVGQGETGEALFLVPNAQYRGYLDRTLDAPKLVPNLFKQKDFWWRSNDLLKVNAEGFYTFVERLGDTYRFKGENVACVDVEEAIRAVVPFDEVVVYGITLPNVDGKIGMASLVSTKHFSIEQANNFLKELKSKIADYALPHILKIKEQKHTTTSTLKIQKSQLSKEGLSNHKSNLHYILLNGSYVSLTEELYDRLLKSEILLSAKETT
jgi:fatty-acyl-CoA synthase